MGRRHSRKAAAGILLAAAGSAIFATSAAATIPQGNLIANPGGELDAGATDDTSSTCPERWACTFNATAVQYGVSDFPSLAESDRIAGGRNFFAGGPGNPVTAMLQPGVDLAAAATEIDAGGVQATISACLGGFQDQDDSGAVSASFIGVSGGALSSVGAYGPNAAARGGQTELVPVSQTRPVPPTTRSADIQLDFTRAGPGTYNDAYADNVTLTLGPLPGSPPPAERCAAPPPPAGKHAKKCKKHHKRKHRAAEAKKHKKCKKRKHRH
jgi:hypothetical protein